MIQSFIHVQAHNFFHNVKKLNYGIELEMALALCRDIVYRTRVCFETTEAALCCYKSVFEQTILPSLGSLTLYPSHRGGGASLLPADPGNQEAGEEGDQQGQEEDERAGQGTG